MDRKLEQADLLVQLGELLTPLQDVVDDPERHDEQSRARARAKYLDSYTDFLLVMEKFCRGEPGHYYGAEQAAVLSALSLFADFLIKMPYQHEGWKIRLKEDRQKVIKAVATVPVDLPSTIHEAQNPFTTYLALRSVFATALNTLWYVDRYVTDVLFHRYLAAVPDAVQVTIITWPKAKHNPGGQTKFDEFLDVSRMYARERGPDRYRLIVNDSIHDRYLRADGTLYNLGGSAKDAGFKDPYTITKMDLSPANQLQIDSFVTGGTEILGPGHPVHP